MKSLSKSKLLAFRQCPRRLWLEVYRPDIREDSSATLASFAAGHSVGEVARCLYDPKRKGIVFDPGQQRHADILSQSMHLLDSRNPLFEAGFSANGALAYADVMLLVKRSGRKMWRMVEVKSSTSVYDYRSRVCRIHQYSVSNSSSVWVSRPKKNNQSVISSA